MKEGLSLYFTTQFIHLEIMKSQSSEIASNRKAFYDYEILDTFEAGIVLLGTEIKSIRVNGANLQEAYIKIVDGEAWLLNSHIAPYSFGNIYNHVERRDRKLLLHKRELKRLKTASQEKGLTLIPLSFYLKEGYLKVKIALAKGKKGPDKRASIKEKEEKRNLQRMIKK